MKIRGIAGNRSARRAGAVWGVLFLAAAACGPAFPATLEWGTYLGGSGNDYARGVALDGDGNLYVVGDTASTGWVSGGWDATFNDGVSTSTDAFLVKLSPAGAHVWSTYLGGSGEEFGYGVALDGDGNILIAGKTKSSGWVSGGWSTFLDPAYTDGFLVKFSSAGAHVWSTYLGGDYNDGAKAVAVDADGNVLVAGETNSDGWVSGGWDVSREATDGFAVKLSSGGAHLWSTYVGGTGTDTANGIAADTDGNMLVVGQTVATSNWVSGGWDTVREGMDGFLVKLSALGSHEWSTYLGGVTSDAALGVAADDGGNVVVCGETYSSGWVFGGAFTEHFGSCDGFVARFSPSGGHVWSSYFGGDGGDSFEALALDAGGDIYVAGATSSRDWVSGGWDTVLDLDGTAISDAVVLRLSAAGIPVWSSYIGGLNVEHGRGVAVAADGAVVVAGNTLSSAWIAGGYDDSHNGGFDAFAVRAMQTAERGALRVTITPPEAVAAGAQWRRVGTPTWRDSGTVESSVVPGEHRVEFRALDYWAAPPVQSVTVTAGTTVEATGEYGPAGAITVALTPAEAVTAGAMWRRVGTSTWHSTGATEFSIPVGDHQVEFKTVDGWTAPSAQPVTVTAGATSGLMAVYSNAPGAIRMTITPPDAVAAGAKWRREGTTPWFDSGATEAGIPPGACRVEFKSLTAWIRPSKLPVTVLAGETLELSASYTDNGGTLRVTITPAEAVTGGAKWRRVGTATWRDSGLAELGIPAGDYEVEFKAVAGWIAPSAQPVTVAVGATSELAASYSDNWGALMVTITPAEAVAAGAQWRRVGTTPWFESGATETVIPAGNWQVEYKPVADWVVPAVQTVTVALGTTAEASAAYAPAGTLQVTITPSVASEAGARWRRVGTTDWLPSGATEDVSPGTHEVEFKEVSGFVAPPSRTVDTPMGAITSIEAVYQYTPSAWGTYLGGDTADYARSVAIDGAGNVYAVGDTQSAGWVSGGWDTDFGPGSDGFVAKFSPTGEHVWSTYFGGANGSNCANDVATAPNGDVIVVGFVNSTNISFCSGYESIGFSRACVLALSSAGAYQWSDTSAEFNEFTSVVVDNEGGVYVTATDNQSYCEMIERNPYPDECQCYYIYRYEALKYSGAGVRQWNRACDGYPFLEMGQDGGIYLRHKDDLYEPGTSIDRLDASTGERLPDYGTYVSEGCSSFAVDAAGNILVMRKDSGGEVSGGWRTTPDAAASGVLEKRRPDGFRIWSTYLNPSKLALDAMGNVYAVGETSIPAWLGGGADATHNGERDATLVKLSPGGAHLWSTYLGGSGYDSAYALCVGGGHVHVAGYTASAGWLQGGWDTTFGGGWGDGFLLKLPAADADPWTIQVTLTPADAVARGARWRLTSDTVWRESGDSVTGVFPGECQVVFTDVYPYDVPPLCTVPSSPGTTVQVVGEYVLSSGEVIFPGTYLGGMNYDTVEGIAADTSGNIYVAGTTASSGWVSGGWDTVLNAGAATTYDAFVVKLTPEGAHLWSTYLGGVQTEFGGGAAVDADGNIIVTGSTSSPGWVSGGWDTVLNDGVITNRSDAFAAKLSPEGAHLWSTYLGGNEGDSGAALAVDNAGNVLVAGKTKSSGWVSGGWDTVLSDGVAITLDDAFAVKLSPEGAHLWSTYLGGVKSEAGSGIAVDSAENVLVAGTTASAGWVSGGWDTVLDTERDDAFAAKLSPEGAHLWSTYLGGVKNDRGYGVAADGMGNVLVVGTTESEGWVSGGWNTTLNNGAEPWETMYYYDGFAVNLSPEGAHLWSTFVGGGQDDSAASVVVKDSATIFITGNSKSSGWVSGGPDTCLEEAGGDAFVVALDAAGPHRWSTFLGGETADRGMGIVLGGAGNLCVAGVTYSESWLTGGWDESYNGDSDGFVAFLPALAIPRAPTGPGAMAIGADTVTWTWVDNSSNEAGFNVWADPGAGAPVTLQATAAANTTSWTQGGLPANSLHTFQVAATNTEGDSPRTAPFSAWTLAAVPAAPVVGNPSGATLDVSVGAGDGNPADTEYALRCVTAGLWVQADGTLGAAAAWQAPADWGTVMVSGLAGDTEYTFEALARNGAGVETAAGPTASGVTLEMVPPTAAVTLLDPTPTQATVLRYGVTFSEPVAPTFTADDVSLTGGLTGSAAVDGADPAYTVTVTVTGTNPDGLTGIAIGADVRDAAGNGFAGALSPQYDVVWWPGFAAPPAGSVLGYTGDPGPVLDASVAAGAPRAAVCQWWRDDGTKSVVAGPATAAWDLGTLSAALDGVYWCSVAYGGLTLTTAPVEVRVRDRIALTAQPADQTIVPGGTAVFTVSAAGGYAPLRYQWRLNGANAPGSPDAAAWTLENVTAEQAGAYSVVVSDSQGDTEESGMAVLKVESNVPAAGLLGLAALAGALAVAGRRRRRGVRR